MTRIVLIGHGGLPDGMRDAVELILGPQPRLAALGLLAGQSPDDLRERLMSLVDGETLVLADIQGGTPWNVASTVAHGRADVEVVAGFSLPMVLAVLTGDASSPTDLAVIATKERGGG
nr:PTS sugar transporter subunit IIA [Kibdelosporangium sp. MJ126-NF4]CEL16201.1 PTS system, mannose-specific IIB component / PTS system, mannose-specific IIA component [Kibdelosporangium sp. MJ126-NF4]CTQ94126.1 PTS system, mannose-specific IIB component (EC 2.7.1.69) / PTS system, mannose-specific IIA component (EC 2.7.1.69) [Kibdelosporangium sp. MJ126-NF4]